MDNLRMNIDGTYTINIDVVDLDNIVQQRLVEAAQIIQEFQDPEDVPIWEALMVVIPYFSNPQQQKALADWDTPTDWINIVKEYNDKKD